MTPDQMLLSNARRQYSLAMQDVLTDFQFIEEGLRLYLEGAYQLIRDRLADTIPFKLDEESLQKDALGKLIEKFSQVSANQNLVETMKALVPQRNKCAHRGFLAIFRKVSNVAEIEKARLELEGLKKETSACFESLIGELKIFGAPGAPAT